MGRDNNNAGIHLIPNGYNGPSENDEYDKYAELLADFPKNSKAIDDRIIEDVTLCNFLSVWDKKGRYNECRCKCSKLTYAELKLKYHKTPSELGVADVTGKICPACGRMYAVREIILKAIK